MQHHNLDDPLLHYVPDIVCALGAPHLGDRLFGCFPKCRLRRRAQRPLALASSSAHVGR